MPAYLLKDKRRKPGIEYRIQINVDEVVEILYVLACDGIASFVRVGHGVQEGLQGTLQQLYKRLLDRIFSGTAQHRVLEDVGDSRRVCGWRAKGDAEDLVFIFIRKGEQVCSCSRMPKHLCSGVQFRDLANPQALKAMTNAHVVFSKYGSKPSVSLPLSGP